MKKLFPIVMVSMLALNANAATPTNTARAASKDATPEGQILRKENYRLPMEQVIVVGQDPYWKKEGAPRWDRKKVDVDLKPATESRLKAFPTYTAEERDDAMKVLDRNSATPKIKLFDIKF